MKKIEVGSKIPEFTLHDQDGITFSIKDYIGVKNLVIYFYPKDNTPGCTKEACYFRDQYEEFSDNGAMIIGISSQSSQSHNDFIEKHKLPFTLLSDRENIVHKMFGVNSNLFPGRVTFVVDKNGTIAYIFDSQINVTKHVDEALRIIKKLKAPEIENV